MNHRKKARIGSPIFSLPLNLQPPTSSYPQTQSVNTSSPTTPNTPTCTTPTQPTTIPHTGPSTPSPTMKFSGFGGHSPSASSPRYTQNTRNAPKRLKPGTPNSQSSRSNSPTTRSRTSSRSSPDSSCSGSGSPHHGVGHHPTPTQARNQTKTPQKNFESVPVSQPAGKKSERKMHINLRRGSSPPNLQPYSVEEHRKGGGRGAAQQRKVNGRRRTLCYY